VRFADCHVFDATRIDSSLVCDVNHVMDAGYDILSAGDVTSIFVKWFSFAHIPFKA